MNLVSTTGSVSVLNDGVDRELVDFDRVTKIRLIIMKVEILSWECRLSTTSNERFCGL